MTGTRHLDANQLAIYRWDDSNNSWRGLTSTLNISSNQVVAQTSDIGNFDVQGPLLCPADNFEPDDAVEAAITIPTDGSPGSRLFDIADDEDWFRFDALAGKKYVIQTSNLATGVDTIIQLYDLNSVDLLASNDNYGNTPASRLDWIAPLDGTYFVRVTRASGSAYSCSASYQFSVTQLNQLYLPLIRR